MYSRIMETYLTVCVPELDISVRQYGWSGETAPQFLARMTNDCLRFNPTVGHVLRHERSRLSGLLGKYRTENIVPTRSPLWRRSRRTAGA